MVRKGICLVLILFNIYGFAEKQEEITPPVAPLVKNGYNVFVTGDFLWWRGTQEGLRYATTGVLVQPGTTLTSSGKVHSVSFPWKRGFRIAIGFYPGHDGWDISTRYTWFQSQSTSKAKNEEGNMLPQSMTLAGITHAQVNGVTSARSQWSLHTHLLDLELGRAFFVSPSLAIRLFFALRGGRITQDWNTHYTSNQIAFGSGLSLPGTITTKQDQDSWGIGIRMGVNTTWIL